MAAPASQHHSGHHVVWQNYHDLRPSVRNSCDDIILKFIESLGTPATANPAARCGLWALVFETWDTNCPVNHPGPIPALSGAKMTVLVTLGWPRGWPRPSHDALTLQS